MDLTVAPRLPEDGEGVEMWLSDASHGQVHGPETRQGLPQGERVSLRGEGEPGSQLRRHLEGGVEVGRYVVGQGRSSTLRGHPGQCLWSGPPQ